MPVRRLRPSRVSTTKLSTVTLGWFRIVGLAADSLHSWAAAPGGGDPLRRDCPPPKLRLRPAEGEMRRDLGRRRIYPNGLWIRGRPGQASVLPPAALRRCRPAPEPASTAFGRFGGAFMRFEFPRLGEAGLARVPESSSFWRARNDRPWGAAALGCRKPRASPGPPEVHHRDPVG